MNRNVIDLSDYLLDNYGACDRSSDCFWGKDAKGQWNGCLKIGWKGRACKHWHPLGVTTLQQLKEQFASKITAGKKDIYENVK